VYPDVNPNLDSVIRMSFLVAFNGQFNPLIIDKVSTGISPVQSINRTTDSIEFNKILHKESDLPDAPSPQRKLDIYQKQEKSYQQQKKRDQACDIMTSPVKLLSERAPASEALALLQLNGFRHLPIVDEKNIIVGMISDREVAGNLTGKSCKDIMINKVIVAQEATSINEIAIILLREKINALPIINHHHQLTGIITLSDILGYVIKTTPFLGRA
jgi:CBS-domain-containing membrane protein